MPKGSEKKNENPPTWYIGVTSAGQYGWQIGRH